MCSPAVIKQPRTSAFYEHHGLDLHGIARQLWVTCTRQRAAEGRETLNSSCARKFFPDAAQNADAPLQEANIA